MEKKRMRAVIGIFLVLSVLLSLLPMPAVADEPEYTATVYVNGSSGNNSNDGKSKQKAVKTMTVAYEKLYAAMEQAGMQEDAAAVGRIVVTGDVSFSTTNGPTPDFKQHNFTVLVTGETADKGLKIKKDYLNIGPTIYENITLTKVKGDTNLTYFCANGYPLTIGENVNTVADANGYYFNLVGGKKDTAYTGNAALTVRAGTYRNLYVGNYKGDMTGDAVLQMTGGAVERTVCANYSGTHKGDIHIALSGGSTVGTLYGGTSNSGTITGDVSVSVSESSVDTLTAGGVNGISGNITLMLANAELGAVTAVCSGTVAAELTAAEGKTLKIGGGVLQADRFNGGGTLVLGRDAELKLAEAVGTTAFSITDTPYNKAYITTPTTAADDTFVYQTEGTEIMSVTATDESRQWIISGGTEPVGVRLIVPEGVSVSVSSGFSFGTAISPTSVATENGETVCFYAGLKAGNYCYKASGSGYYSVQKNFILTEQDIENGKTIQADPGQTVKTGFEQTAVVNQYTDEALAAIFPSSKEQWAGYEQIFTTPAFTNSRTAHQQTTQDEMWAFLESLDDPDDNLYLYTAGVSPIYSYRIPVVIFTTADLSDADTLEAAAARINENEKATIHYQAEIHGNESAGGEGALAMIRSLDGDYGDTVLESVNIYVIPRVNVEGARQYQRANVAQGIDMNRDHLFVQSEEVAIVHHIYNLFMPEVAIDGHEFTATTTTETGAMDDVQVGASGSLNSDAAVNDIAQDMVHNAFDAASRIGLRPYNYGSYASTVNNAIGRAYYGLYGSLSFLIETRGIGTGLSFFERRVMSQYAVTESFINYVAENEAKIRGAVARGRERLAEQGGVYGEDDDFVVLTHGVSKKNGYSISRPTWNLSDGSPVNPNATGTIYRYDIAERKRPRPTAYVIPRGEAWAEAVAVQMTKNGIRYYALENHSAALLQQYSGTETSAALSEETAVVFPDGAYVFPMNQVGANIIAMTMEPDVTDSSGYNGTLLQSGVISANGGVLPIYRYSHDLDGEGKITLLQLPEAPSNLEVIQPAQECGTGVITGFDPEKAYEYRSEFETEYKALASGAEELTGLEIGRYYVRFAESDTELASKVVELEVIDRHISEYVIYVDGENGANSADGRKAERAVADLNTAYEKLRLLMRYAPEGTEGTIVFTGDVTLKAATEFPAHDYAVTLTSLNGDKGLISSYNVGFHGDTCLTHMHLTLGTGSLRYIAANGHRLELGEALTCKPSGSYYFNLIGGGNESSVTGDTDLIIRSGTWRNVYAAGYKGGLNGNAGLTVSGGEITAVVQSSYSGATSGNVTMQLSNVAIGGIIYGGNTSSKDVGGNVTVTLGEGVSFKSLYAGSRDAGSVNGTVTVIVDGASVQKPIYGGCANATGTVKKSVLLLKSGELNSSAEADEVILDTSAGGTFSFHDNLTVDAVVGGGTVSWPTDKVLTVRENRLSGSTFVRPIGTFSDAACICTPIQAAAESFFCPEEKVFVLREQEGKLYWTFSDYYTVSFMTEDEVFAVERVAIGGTATNPKAPTRAGYDFDGWRYADGTRMDFSQPITESLVLKAAWTAETREEPGTLVSVPINGQSRKINLTVSDGKAAIEAISAAQLRTMATDTVLSLDLTGVNASELSIPGNTAKNIAKSGSTGLEVRMPNGTSVVFDCAALSAIADQTGIRRVRLSLNQNEAAEQSMNAAQKAAAQSLNGALILNSDLRVGGRQIHELYGGTAELSVEYPDASSVRVWYLDEDGSKTPIASRFDGKRVCFTASHFSVYAIETSEECRFADVSTEEYYCAAVLWAVENGITDGVDETHFAPNDATTRAQLVTFLWRSVGAPKPTAEVLPYQDVNADEYYYQAALWATENGITNGVDETHFAPNEPATRAQAITFLARLNGVQDNVSGYRHGFSDVAEEDYFHNAVAWAAENGIANGTDKATFAPNEACLRGQAVTFLYKSRAA